MARSILSVLFSPMSRVRQGETIMIRAVVTALMSLFVGVCAISCDEGSDPGPFDMDGWIGQCEDRCDQLDKCVHDQLVFDHGDLDNCKGSCEYRLDYDDDHVFLEETPDECLQAMYDYVRCVFHLGCDDLTTWATGDGEDIPCADLEDQMYSECDGEDIMWFLDDAGYPVAPE